MLVGTANAIHHEEFCEPGRMFTDQPIMFFRSVTSVVVSFELTEKIT